MRKILIEPEGTGRLAQARPAVQLVDVRSREEFEAVHLEGSVLMSQPVMQEIHRPMEPRTSRS